MGNPTSEHWEVDVRNLGYSPYRGYHANGVLSEEGLCMVKKNGFDIMADLHDVWEGRFYDLDGQLVSEVKKGTGKQLLFFSYGTPRWELDLIKTKYARMKLWHGNGQLAQESLYKSGILHGLTTRYYPNGQIKYQGEYSHGMETGPWLRYSENGEPENEKSPFDASGGD